MILAWLLLLTGLTISAVAIYYSVVGLTAIFSAAAIPIIIMGSALEVGKLVCASWLKANWERAPRFMRYYMTIAVVVLMIITSMGIFGFLSKAHNDQNLVSGDVQSKIAIYDEKIKTERENIDANRKILKQLDESVDQVMGRSQDEKGAEKAVAIRRGQQKERARIAQDIATAQQKISKLNEERAPIAAEVRKVEAEVGPIKYIAKFIYGERGADENMLEQAVTWIIILIVIVFDPLAVIMLLAAQMTFGWHRKQNTDYEPDDGPLTDEQIEQVKEEANVKNFDQQPISSLWPFPSVSKNVEVPSETPSTALGGDITAPEETPVELQPDFLKKAEERVQERMEDIKQEDIPMPLEQWNKMIEEAERAVEEEKKYEEAQRYHPQTDFPEAQNYTEVTGDRVKPDLTEVIETEDSKKKTYMIKDQQGNIQLKNR
jgi:hypothetical protein